MSTVSARPRKRANGRDPVVSARGEPISPEASDLEAVQTGDLPPAGPGPLRDPLVTGLRRLTQWAHTCAWSHWRTRGITATQLHAILVLAERPQGLTPTQLAQELRISAATVCDCAGALKKKRLVIQKRNPEDGRKQILQLTANGLQIADELLVSDPLLKVFEGISGFDQQLLHILLLKMMYALEASGALSRQRTCVRCRFFRPFVVTHSNTPHHCLQTKQPLSERQVRFDCPVFERAAGDAQRALWEGFLDGQARRISSDAPFHHREPLAVASSDGCGL
jgi:DNA-binding MarR family transcriptional regulator